MADFSGTSHENQSSNPHVVLWFDWSTQRAYEAEPGYWIHVKVWARRTNEGFTTYGNGTAEAVVHNTYRKSINRYFEITSTSQVIIETDIWFPWRSGANFTVGVQGKLNIPDVMSGEVAKLVNCRRNTCFINYDSNGGTGAPAKQDKYYGRALTLSSQRPSKNGYVFAGWSLTRNGAVAYQPGDLYHPDDKDVVLYAVWRAITYEIKYNGNGGTNVPPTQYKQHGKELRLTFQKPTRTGYKFLGWNRGSSSNVEFQPGALFTGNYGMTLYAVWEKETYSITYSANGGTGAPKTQTKTYGIDIVLSSEKPTREGHMFLGWSESSTAVTPTYVAGARFTANRNTTLYAVWSLNEYRVVFNANGGSVEEKQRMIKNGQPIGKLPIPSRSNYKFLGWSKNTEGNAIIDENHRVYGNMTLYAIWELLANCKYKVEGMYKSAMMYQNKTGQYKTGVLYIKKNGIYVRSEI